MADAAYPWSTRLAVVWGHLAPQALIVSIVGVILLRVNPPGDPTMALGVSIALITFVVASWLLMRRHDRGLCELCMGAMPLNPSELAVRYKRRFWLSHSGAQPRYVVPYFAVLIGSSFLTGQSGLLIWSLVQTSMIYLILAYSTHRRLQPWCPWCRGGGGGGEDEPVAPDPVPEDHRQLI
ncbi:MAG: hypothetical protein ABI775_01245 [Pseudonocardiales bacterium]|nr:hypothetical protein [Actinomycetota bacterium]